MGCNFPQTTTEQTYNHLRRCHSQKQSSLHFNKKPICFGQMQKN